MLQSKLQADQLFANTVKNAESLRSSSEKVVLNTCKVIHNNIYQLIEYSEQAANAVAEKKQVKTEELYNTESEIILITGNQRKVESELRTLKASLEGVREKGRQIDNDIEKLNSEIARLRRRAEEEETKRVDAAIDWIPGVGLIGGLITGRYERVIPGHSVVAGIISHITQEQEEANRKIKNKQSEKSNLNEQLQSIEENKNRYETTKKNISAKLVQLTHEIDMKEKEKKLLAKNLTDLKNTGMELTLICKKHTLMNCDLDMIETLIEVGELENEVNNFIQGLTSTRQSFAAITF